ncbi:MAG: thioredoxin [Elusimicrobia bacterium]|nr:thioredoxin [Elusimicrobiota bacterium]
MAELQLTDASFKKEVLESSKPVLVDLWAPWCGPCRMLGPVVEELATEYAGKAVVGKLNTDENSDTMTAYRVSAIPTLLFFKGGKLVEQMVGVQPKSVIKAKLDALIAA